MTMSVEKVNERLDLLAKLKRFKGEGLISDELYNDAHTKTLEEIAAEIAE